jgi:hypothetical protein
MVMVVLYLIGAASQLFPTIFYITSAITNVRGQGREATIELVEALLWILSLGTFVYLLYRSRKSGMPFPARFWFAFFALLCFVAAGEELSWGEHLGLVTPSETMQAVNAQQEFNFHNLNIALLLGLSPDHFLYSRLDNFNKVLNPTFYLLCITAWLIIPALRRRGRGAGSKWLSHFPIPARRTSAFFAANLAAYVVVDRLLYDVGELFEFAVAITMLFAAMDFLTQARQWKVEKAADGSGRQLAPIGPARSVRWASPGTTDGITAARKRVVRG